MFWCVMAIVLTFYFGSIGLVAVVIAIILAGE